MDRGVTSLHGMALVLMSALAACSSLALLVLQSKPYLAVAPAIGMLVLVAMFRWPQVGLYIIVGMVPFTAWRGLTENYKFLTISKFIGIMLILVMFARGFARAGFKGRLGSWMWIPLAGFFVVAVLSAMLSQWGLSGFFDFRQLITAYLMFAMCLLFLDADGLTKWLPGTIIVSDSLSALMAIAGKHLHLSMFTMNLKASEISERALGAENDPNFFAAVVLVSLPFIVNWIFTKKNPLVRGLMVFLLLANIYAVTITYSRSVIMVGVFTMGLVSLEYTRLLRPRHLGLVTLALFLALAVGATRIESTDLWTRMKTLSTPSTDPSIMRRASYIKVAAMALKEHPIIGIGLSSFPLYYERTPYSVAFALNENDYQRMAHNTVIEVTVGTGFLGFFFYGGTVMAALWALFRSSRLPQRKNGVPPTLMRTYGYALVSLMTSLLFLSSPWHKYLWLFLGVAAAIWRITREQETLEPAVEAVPVGAVDAEFPPRRHGPTGALHATPPFGGEAVVISACRRD